MPSGEFRTVPLSSIIIDREGRQRRAIDPKHIDSLAESIGRIGLIHTPVITRENVLVSGECRTLAMRQLGWTDTQIQYVDELDEAELKAIELEENIKRLGIDWKDECRGIAEYHALRRAQKPDWTQAETAAAIGIAPQTISYKLKVADELTKENSRIATAAKFSVAKGILERSDSRAAANEMDKHTIVASEAYGSTQKGQPYQILTADFTNWIATYDGPRFNLIHCDFPYGINADKFNQGAASALGGYVDTPDVYRTLMAALFGDLDRVALDSCHLVFWFSMTYYEETLHAIREADFICDGFPLFWHKSDNVGTLPDPERGPRRTYETAFFASRGDRKVVSAVANSYAAPTDRFAREHMSVKPEPVLRHFFRMLVDEHTRLLDPTCGSGSSLRAADALGAGFVLGLERNDEYAEGARKAFGDARRLRLSTI